MKQMKTSCCNKVNESIKILIIQFFKVRAFGVRVINKIVSGEINISESPYYGNINKHFIYVTVTHKCIIDQNSIFQPTATTLFSLL